MVGGDPGKGGCMRPCSSGFGISLLLGALLAFSGCALVGPPSMLTQARPPLHADQVSFWIKPAWPSHFVLLAKLDTHLLGWNNSPELNCRILEKLQQQAARIGANAVLLADPPPTGGGSPGMRAGGMAANSSYSWGPSTPMIHKMVTYKGYAAYVTSHPGKGKAQSGAGLPSNCNRLP